MFADVVLLHLILLNKVLLATRALKAMLAGNVLLQLLLLDKALLAARALETVLSGSVLLQRGLVDEAAITGGASWVRREVLRVYALMNKIPAAETLDIVFAENVLPHRILLRKVFLTARALEAVLADVVLLQRLLRDKALLAACALETVLSGIVLLQQHLVREAPLAGGAVSVAGHVVRRHRQRCFRFLRGEAAELTLVHMRGGGHVLFQSFPGGEVLVAVRALRDPLGGLFLGSLAMLGRGQMLFQSVLAVEDAVAGDAAAGVDGSGVLIQCGSGGKLAIALGAGDHGWRWLLGRERILGLKADPKSLGRDAGLC